MAPPGKVRPEDKVAFAALKQTTPPDGDFKLAEVTVDAETVFAPLQAEAGFGPVMLPHGSFLVPAFIVGAVGFVVCCRLELPTTSRNSAFTVPPFPVTLIASEVFEFT